MAWNPSAADMEASRLRIEVPPTGHTPVGSQTSISEVGYGWFDYDDQLSNMDTGGQQADHLSVLNRCVCIGSLRPPP